MTESAELQPCGHPGHPVVCLCFDPTTTAAPHPQWLRDLVGAAWAARETFRLMGAPHSLLEQATAALPDDVRKLMVSP